MATSGVILCETGNFYALSCRMPVNEACTYFHALVQVRIYSQLKTGCATWPGYKPFGVYPVCHTFSWAICTLMLGWQTGCTPNCYDINRSIVLQQAAKALLIFSQAVRMFHLYCLYRFFVRCFFQVSSLTVAVAQWIFIVQWPCIHFLLFFRSVTAYME